MQLLLWQQVLLGCDKLSKPIAKVKRNQRCISEFSEIQAFKSLCCPLDFGQHLAQRLTQWCLHLNELKKILHFQDDLKNDEGVETAKACLRVARDGGINTFDNAEVYGRGEAERIMGLAFEQLAKEDPVKWRRSDLVVTTKVNQLLCHGDLCNHCPCCRYFLEEMVLTKKGSAASTSSKALMHP